MELMGKPGRPRTYPDSFRERAVRLVWEWRDARGISTGGIADVARQLDINRETLRKWVVDEEVVEGNRPGMPRGARERIAELERENKELRRANEILKSASAFFAAELDRQPKK
jgi:transposase